MPTDDTSIPDPDSENFPSIPLVLGVTGHMDYRPEDDAALRAAVASIFGDFRGRYPRTPLVLLCSLARGADELVADEACKLGIQLHAALPFPVPIYAASSTFSGHPIACEAFQERIRSGCTMPFVVPLPGSPADDDIPRWEEVIVDQTARRRAYANAGGYIVRHCHALIALWDGERSGRASGTEEIVQCKLEGRPPALYPHNRPLLLGSENGPVFVVHTPRAGSATVAGNRAPGEVRVLVPNAAGRAVSEGERAWRLSQGHRFWNRVVESVGARDKLPPERAEWHQFHEICQSVDDFNRDLIERSLAIHQEMTRTLPGQAIWQQADRIGPPGAMRRLVLLRLAAASLARFTHPFFAVCQFVLFVLLFFAVLSFHLYAHLEDGEHRHHPWLLGCFVTMLVACALVIAWVWFHRVSERRLDYRALAEVLRVRIFWGAAGIGESVADSYLGQMRTEISWARRALQSAAPPAEFWRESFEKLSKTERLERLRAVKTEWIVRQENYFHDGWRSNHQKAVLLRQCGFFTAIMGWVVATVLLGWGVFRPVSVVEPNSWWLVASGGFVLVGGLLIAYCERSAFEEVGKQFERLHQVFAQGAKETERELVAANPEAVQKIMIALGRESITENVQWLILRRSRPFELLIH